jgi:nucleotide-binding universal stress UspA family protein
MKIFERVVCGFDGSPDATAALRQVVRLRPREGRVVTMTFWDPGVAAQAGWQAEAIALEVERAAFEVTNVAAHELEHVPYAETRLVRGSPFAALRTAIETERATLVAVGASGHGRTAGVLLGSLATRIVHHASCPVLVARRTEEPDRFPRSVVVGVDGSREALAALTVAEALGRRLGVPTRALAATGGKPVDPDGLQNVADLRWSESTPVDALVQASADADLVVVGSRGLHGLRAFGSVSEQVAHRAACSVLVVRPLVWELVDEARAATVAAGAEPEPTLAWSSELLASRVTSAGPLRP